MALLLPLHAFEILKKWKIVLQSDTYSHEQVDIIAYAAFGVNVVKDGKKLSFKPSWLSNEILCTKLISFLSLNRVTSYPDVGSLCPKLINYPNYPNLLPKFVLLKTWTNFSPIWLSKIFAQLVG